MKVGSAKGNAYTIRLHPTIMTTMIVPLHSLYPYFALISLSDYTPPSSTSPKDTPLQVVTARQATVYVE